VRKQAVALLLFFGPLCLLSPAAIAAEITCKKSPALTGKCSTVKGSLGLTPGIGVTLVSEDGTRTIIKAPPDSNADIASDVMQNWLYWQSKTGSIKTRINGTYELCPLPPAADSAGFKDFGCINKGTRISEDKSSPAS
jgi:hypothetical protein